MTEIISKDSIQNTSNAKEFIKDYWGGRSNEFADLRKAELKSNKYQRWETEIKSKLPSNLELKILDVGCGCGFFSIMLDKLGHLVTGIDITPTMIEQGKNILEQTKTQAELLVMDAEKLEFANDTFDVVIARNVTWNLPHPEIAYKEWLRVLKTGGILLNYDAEYAQNHHKQNRIINHAHNRLSKEEWNKCHQIYHMLEISRQNRPDWDMQVLERLTYESIEIDLKVGERIYMEEDEFYIPTPMFGIKVVK